MFKLWCPRTFLVGCCATQCPLSHLHRVPHTAQCLQSTSRGPAPPACGHPHVHLSLPHRLAEGAKAPLPGWCECEAPWGARSVRKPRGGSERFEKRGGLSGFPVSHGWCLAPTALCGCPQSLLLVFLVLPWVQVFKLLCS